MKIKGSDLFRFISISFILVFLAIYFAQSAGYFDYNTNKRFNLTNKAISKFEKDVKSGKKIDSSKYLPKDKNYDNKVSKIGMSVSNFIDRSFNKVLGYLFKEINDAISENN